MRKSSKKLKIIVLPPKKSSRVSRTKKSPIKKLQSKNEF